MSSYEDENLCGCGHHIANHEGMDGHCSNCRCKHYTPAVVATLKICIARLYYNEKVAIEMTHPHMADVLYFDGKFPSFEQVASSDYSTDGSNELIDSFDNTQRFEFAGYIVDKLTYLFKKAGELGYDAVLLLSCDEWIEGDWPLFCKNLQWRIENGDDRKIFNVKFMVLSGDPRPLKAKPRLFINPSHFSVKGAHWRYHYDGRSLTHDVSEADHFDIEGITLVHDNRIRPEWRDKLMTKYQEAMPPVKRDTSEVAADPVDKRGIYVSRRE